MSNTTSTKNQYAVNNEELLDLLNTLNKDNGYTLPTEVTLARGIALRECLAQLKRLTGNDQFREEIRSTIYMLEKNKEDLELHINCFCKAITKHTDLTDPVLNSCMQAFFITLTVLKVYKLQN